MIDITDGTSSYLACYVISTKMAFRTNAHVIMRVNFNQIAVLLISIHIFQDIYFNDCFGKASGTKVVPGSVINAQITPLPLWQSNPTDGTVNVTVEVPG